MLSPFDQHMCGSQTMKQRHLVNILTAALLLTLFSYTAARASKLEDANEDTDTRMIDAKVVEVTDARISIVARTGVEHVIAIDRTDTKVTIDGLVVSLQDLREGDVVTVELDADNPMKFAKNISMRSDQTEVARNRR
jgi:preprotein translocase subunit YajC